MAQLHSSCRNNSSRSFLFLLIVSTLSLASPAARAQEEPDALRKPTDDVENKYTSVGSIGLTITNFGTIGTRNIYSSQPSCEYPRGSRIEHIVQGALWVGALVRTKDSTDSRNGLLLVSTGANDRTRISSAQSYVDGYEFNSALLDSITELSTLSDDRPPTSQFSPMAVSHQDFICDYSDRYTRVPSTGDTITNHIPLKLHIHQESYAWNFPFADFFVILRYSIINDSPDTLDSVYVGFWNDAVVRDQNLVRPGTTGYYDYTGQGYDSLNRLAYAFDFNGTPGGQPADSYVGMKLLGTTPFPRGVDSLGNLPQHTYYNAWLFNKETEEKVYTSPQYDFYEGLPYDSRYTRMTTSIPRDRIDAINSTLPRGYNSLLSTGPFPRMNPHDTVEVVFAVTCAKKFGNVPARFDLPEQRKTLYSNIGWAQKAYNGEDVNGNNNLDPGEDIARRDSVSPSEMGLRYEPDGKITRYLLPAPPNRPKVRAEVANRTVTLYWDKSAEETVDPVSGERDFEGYRVYRSNTGADFLNHDSFLLDLSLIGEFDKVDGIGYDAGLNSILMDSAKIFPGDTIKYWYRFPPKGVTVDQLNGWQYLYGVSAFDRGDSVNKIPSLESAKSYHRVVTGTPPAQDPSISVGVYPNPYYVNAYWDGDRERLRKIYFYNLPALCQIKIYTLAGDVVAIIDHDAATYNGAGIEWFNQFGDRGTVAQFAGGEHAWDLITRFDQAIATGLYLFTVENRQTGDIKRGKFLIVK